MMKGEVTHIQGSAQIICVSKNGGNAILGCAPVGVYQTDRTTNSLASQRGFLFDKSDLCNGILWDCLQEVEKKRKSNNETKAKEDSSMPCSRRQTWHGHPSS